MTGHMWDGQWILANGRRWNALPADVQALITKHVTAAGAQAARRHPPAQPGPGSARSRPRAWSSTRPTVKSFRDTLSKAGFYTEWRGKFGDEAMAKLEKYSGKLG